MVHTRVLDRVMAGVPANGSPVERLQWIGRQLAEMPQEARDMLRGAIDRLLCQMEALGASDMDVGGPGCREQVWYRVHGEKAPEEAAGRFSCQETDVILHAMLSDSQRQYLYEHRNLDFSYTSGSNGHAFRFRADLYFDLDHLALNVRHIPNQIRPFKDLGLSPEVEKAVLLMHNRHGLTLVTGVTGSGKSATLDSILDANNETASGQAVIIGAPVETIHASKRCIVRHREVGRDVMSFKEGTVQALRQDPDLIVIGEMRDPDTIVTALEVTDSGHKVFSTLHTASAVESIDRIIAECPSAEQNRVRERLADVLTCIISQKLVPSLDGRRVLAKEVLLMTPSVRAAIKNDNTGEIYQMMHEGKSAGMNALEQDLKRLVTNRRIAPKEALTYANNKRRMEELL